jgi:hypothetical protein
MSLTRQHARKAARKLMRKSKKSSNIHDSKFICNNSAITQDFFTGGSKACMLKKVPNIQRITNNDILKIVNIVFSGGGGAVAPIAPPPRNNFSRLKKLNCHIPIVGTIIPWRTIELNT